MRSLSIFCLLIVSLACGSANSESDAESSDSATADSAIPGVIASPVSYTSDTMEFEGYLASPEGVSDSTLLPGVLIIHDWNGLGEYEKMRAERVAELGYVAFAADLYGKDVRPETPEASAAESGKYRADPELWRARLLLGLLQLRNADGVDRSNLAAVGYCFGGSSVIELARTGADLAGVVSFHGGLSSEGPKAGAEIQAPIRVLHGAKDPFVSEEGLTAFEEEMQVNNVDYARIDYPDAVHCFTQQEVGTDSSTGCAYDAAADAASWQDMQTFFGEVFEVSGNPTN